MFSRISRLKLSNHEILNCTTTNYGKYKFREFSIMERYNKIGLPEKFTNTNKSNTCNEIDSNLKNNLNTTVNILPIQSRGLIPKEVQFPTWSMPVQPNNPQTLKIAIIGPPNSGKSSLLNALTNSWVSSVSPKVNTTNSQIRGMLTEENYQLVFIDSPGIIPSHSTKNFCRPLLSSAWRGYEEADLCLLVIDCVKRPTHQIFEIVRLIAPKNVLNDDPVSSLAMLSSSNISSHSKSIGISPALIANRISIFRDNNNSNNSDSLEENNSSDKEIENSYKKYLPPICLVLNKIDLASQPKWIKSRLKEFESHGRFKNVFYISAKKKIGLEKLKLYLKNQSKPASWLYPSDMITSLSKLEQVEQLIRTYLFCWFNKDIPYKIDQKTIGWNESKDAIAIEQELKVQNLKVKKILSGIRNRLLFQLRKNVMYKLSQMWKTPVILTITIKIQDVK